ncbi:MAG: hypothetical protein MZV65_26595 [Chromatiales bacterium]|nr:hypothetical protein [Chromatiales bacterium]
MPDSRMVERDLVGRLLPLGALHQRDHAVEAATGPAPPSLRRRGWSVSSLRAAGDAAAVAAGLAQSPAPIRR